MWYLNEKTEQRWAWAKAFDPEHCKQIIEQCSLLPSKKAEIIDNSVGIVNESIRKSKVGWLPSTRDSPFAWIYNHCADVIKVINDQFFGYDLDYIENLQFTSYDSAGSHFEKHVDNLLTANKNRKISFSVQLSDPEDYEGGDLLLYNSSVATPTSREQGVINFFPSWTLHEVTPITSGTRHALIGWCHGPKFK